MTFSKFSRTFNLTLKTYFVERNSAETPLCTVKYLFGPKKKEKTSTKFCWFFFDWGRGRERCYRPPSCLSFCLSTGGGWRRVLPHVTITHDANAEPPYTTPPPRLPTIQGHPDMLKLVHCVARTVSKRANAIRLK